jgi:hypothetical protein
MATSLENGAHSACVAATLRTVGPRRSKSCPNKQIVRIIELIVSSKEAFMDVA